MSNSDRLRQHGYTIHHRPSTGEPVWRLRDGTEHTESEAVSLIAEWEAHHRWQVEPVPQSGLVRVVAVALLALILGAALASQGATPDRPKGKVPPKKVEPVLTFTTQYGEMIQVGQALIIEGPHWTARGNIRDDGSIYLLWTERNTGRLAPSVYHLRGNQPVGLWGYAPEAFLRDDGTMAGECREDRLIRVVPAVPEPDQ